MSEAVSYSTAGEIATVMIDSPPVNAVNQGVRAGLKRVFTELRDKPGVKAIVLGCAGKTFVAGADIKEFDTGIARARLPRGTAPDRGQPGASRCRRAWHRARRRHRNRPRLSLPRRASGGALRIAGTLARHHPRRRRHPAPAPGGAARSGARHDADRQAPAGRQGSRSGTGGPGGRRRGGRGGGGLRAQAGRRRRRSAPHARAAGQRHGGRGRTVRCQARPGRQDHAQPAISACADRCAAGRGGAAVRSRFASRRQAVIAA